MSSVLGRVILPKLTVAADRGQPAHKSGRSLSSPLEIHSADWIKPVAICMLARSLESMFVVGRLGLHFSGHFGRDEFSSASREFIFAKPAASSARLKWKLLGRGSFVLAVSETRPRTSEKKAKKK